MNNYTLLISISNNFKILLRKLTYLGSNKELLNLATIAIKSKNPNDLYNDWYKKAEQNKLPCFFSLANIDRKSMKVNSRIMGTFSNLFKFLTDKRTEKCQDLESNPNVAINLLWIYNENNVKVVKQINGRGAVKKLTQEETVKEFEKLPLPLKVRWLVTTQNKPMKDWKTVQIAYEKLLVEISESIKLNPHIDMPDYMVGYEIYFEKLLFYKSIFKEGYVFLPDRVIFERDTGPDGWKYIHLMP